MFRPKEMIFTVFAILILAASCSCEETSSNGDVTGDETDWDYLVDFDVDGEDIASDIECPDGTTACGTDCCVEGEECVSGTCCRSEKVCNGRCCLDEEECIDGLCTLVCSDGVVCYGEEGEGHCCSSDEICFMGECVTPGDACDELNPCPEGYYCEPMLGRCLPESEYNDCTYEPPPGTFDPIAEWTWTGSDTVPRSHDVMSMPAVADINGDRIPEVVFSTFADLRGEDLYGTEGVLRAVRGNSGEEVFSVRNPRVMAVSAPALGDIDLDGLPEIIIALDPPTYYGAAPIAAFDGDGSLLWRSHDDTGASVDITVNWGGPSIADIDLDTIPEVIIGRAVISADGLVLWNDGWYSGGRIWAVGPFSVVADVDDDPEMEILHGNVAYNHDGAYLWWRGDIDDIDGDGSPAIADIDGDGDPELVVSSWGTLRVQDSLTGDTISGPVDIPGDAQCPPPIIADFDGDTLPEAGVAGLSNYTVFDFEFPGGSIDTSVLWSKPIHEGTSGVTGSSVFDFDGDNVAEVVYADECSLWVFSGPAGDELLRNDHASATGVEYMLIVDVDADGQTEIVEAMNTISHEGESNYVCNYLCSDVPGWDGCVHGIRVYGSESHNWVRTRKIWNQHTYHVTNVNEDGTIPSPESKNWQIEFLNNYRQNIQPEGIFNAPDLVPRGISVDLRHCPESYTISVMVFNQGSAGVPAGVQVGFYRGLPDGEHELLGYAATERPLMPGTGEYVQFVWDVPEGEDLDREVSFFVVVDDTTSGIEIAVHECIEDNNTSEPIDTVCHVLE